RPQRAVVAFPQPDSPTSPSVSPAQTAKVIPATALTLPTVRLGKPARIGKFLTRSTTSSSGASPPAGRASAPVAGLVAGAVVTATPSQCAAARAGCRAARPGSGRPIRDFRPPGEAAAVRRHTRPVLARRGSG